MGLSESFPAGIGGNPKCFAFRGMSVLSLPIRGLQAFASSASKLIESIGLLRWLKFGLFLACGLRVNAQVTLEWDADPEPDVIGYRLYYGVTGGEYTDAIDAGNVTSAAVPDLTVGETYYFAVTAYNAWGIESLYSNEVSVTVTEPPPMIFRALSVEEVPGWLSEAAPELPAVFPAEGELAVEGLNSILIAGWPGVALSVEASSDLMEWQILATDLNSTGVMVATDPGSRNWTRRFYRVREVGIIPIDVPPETPPDDPPQAPEED
jgi:hypothetical protein